MRGNQTLVHLCSYIKGLPHLSQKEKDILLRRLKALTLEKIGKKYGVTGERVRQIEKQAIIKALSTSYQQSLFRE